MINIFEYLLSKTNNSEQDEYGDWSEDFGLKFPDDKKPRWDKKGKVHLWWKLWSILKTDGPMSKKDLLKKLRLKETSYSTMFTELSKMNIIVPNKSTKKLEPMDPSKWKVTKTWVKNGKYSYSGYWQYI